MISGLAIALYRGPDFAAVCLAYFPLIILFITIFRKKVKESSKNKIEVSKKLGGIVEETLYSIKLIISFAQEEKSSELFTQVADQNRK